MVLKKSSKRLAKHPSLAISSSMNAELAQKLTELSLEGKSEVVSFLMPFVTPNDDEEIESKLMNELETRIQEHRSNPSGSITFEEFKQRQFARD
jgi:hypothetical protein